MTQRTKDQIHLYLRWLPLVVIVGGIIGSYTATRESLVKLESAAIQQFRAIDSRITEQTRRLERIEDKIDHHIIQDKPQ